MTTPHDHDLGPLDQIPAGEGRNFNIAEVAIAVFRTHGDQVFATQPACPHRQGPLADGLLGGATLVCPLHDAAFDLATGVGLASTMGAGCTLATYPARLSDQRRIVVTLPG